MIVIEFAIVQVVNQKAAILKNFRFTIALSSSMA